MSRGIIIFGAAGSGKTTLGRELAGRLGFLHIDIDDYIWRWDTEIPYTVLRSRQERIETLIEAVSKDEHFVMTGSMDSIRGFFTSLFELAVFLTVPTDIRLQRLGARKSEQFGERILPGGDMYEQNEKFLREAAAYDTGEPPQVCLKTHKQWAAELKCPILYLNGMKAIAENAAWVEAQYLLTKQQKP